MLDLACTEESTSVRHTTSSQVRHDVSLGESIEQAATYQGVDKSVFLRSAIRREVARVLEAQVRHVLTPEDAKQFAETLDTPPRPTERALRAAEAYRKRVVHAD